MILNGTIRNTLAGKGAIAVVGASDAPRRPVDQIGRYLIDKGFTVIPVHPKRKNVWGLETYPSLTDVPEPVEIVNLFRASEYCPDHARETLQMPALPKIFWMQQGIFSPEARSILEPQGVMVLEDSCIMVVHGSMLL